MSRPPMTSNAYPELTARQLNRTTLLRRSLLERSSEDVITAVRRLVGLQAQYANSPYIALWSRLADLAIVDLERTVDARGGSRPHGLTQEAERLVRFIVPEAARHDVRWTARR